ncbi:MAG TPA: hypothetical protein VN845_00275 [Solirubrobacteraceae bacterium]|nr:hypothetical protein [Solirubrobacteraceae bacterium]
MTPPAASASRELDYRAPAHRRGAVPGPRRVSGPAHGRVAAEPVRNPGIALRTAGALERVSASSLLDRLIVGRAWIGLLAFALIGVVAMQLVVLKLNTGIGRTLQRQVLLQRENAELGIENSVYSAESRIAPLAAAAGMSFAPPGTVHFVAASAADMPRAASVLASAAQTSAGSQPGSGEASDGEAAASSTASPATAATSETTDSTEVAGGSGGSSGGSDSTGGSSEQSSAANTESSTSSSVASPSAAAPSSTEEPPSGGSEQTQGVSAATPASEPGASAVGASASAGGTQAGPRG